MNKRPRSASGGPPQKRAAANAGSDDEDFDHLIEADQEDIGLFEEDDAIDLSEVQDGKNWPRPEPPSIDPAKDAVQFQQIEIDYILGKPRRGMTRPDAPNSVASIRMFGVNATGNSVCLYVHGFEPYFYVEAPYPGFGPDECETFRNTMNTMMAQSQSKFGLDKFVLRVEIQRKQSVWYHRPGPHVNFLRVTVAIPTLVTPLRTLLERGNVTLPNGSARPVVTYESNVLFALRFMIDADVPGCNWVTAPAGKYELVADPATRTTTCQIEGHIFWEDLVSHPISEKSDIAPLRILSVDIECAGRKGHFPEAEKDPVIQIASMVTVQGQGTVVRNILTLGGCSAIVGAQVMSFDREQDLLMRWRDLLVKSDPDIIIGYNICNFDLPYLVKRAETLKLPGFMHWGRVRAQKLKMRDAQFSSKAYGTHGYKEITIEGRVQFDMLMAVTRDHKLTSYSLNNVSAHFLGEQKEDVHHSCITDLQNGNDDTRRRLAVYCLKDAYLPQRLFDKLMYMFNMAEMARVTGVPLSYLLTRGQSIKVFCQILRKCRSKNLLVPNIQRTAQGDGVSYEGATVLDAKQGFYEEPIATLDFASLYPSIMMAHNLCYSTLVPPNHVAQYEPHQVTRTPSGDVFVKRGVAPGVLPEILEELLGARKRAKADLKKETDEFKRAVLDGRQLALKVSANSVYGFTGATVGKMPCLEISKSVTSFGREMIEMTRGKVEAHYTRKNGYANDAVVIYGDTDSVMVNFKTGSGDGAVAEAMRLGAEAADFITKELFPPPVRLEFEKVYFPYLLINKKRYAGLYWTKPEKWDKMDAKGIETVRRDNCLLVRNVVKTSLEKILMERDVKGAVDYVKKTISDLLMDRVDLSWLVVSKSLTKDVEAYDMKAAHVELAKKMRLRDPVTAPGVGDRVPYVIIKASKDTKTYQKAEDPVYALDNNIPIDAQHYLDHHLEKPLLRIFEPILKNARDLLTGAHTRSISVATPSARAGGIMMFTKKVATCLSCRAPLEKGRKTLCKHCEPKQADVYTGLLTKAAALEDQYNRLWTQCQRCQGSLHQDVLCSNRDCPIFYRRKKAGKELQEAHNSLARFDDW
ncbi:unnamed protein product [Pedinophyceae sp. YPF-701]|nr:unnamed protein product [Pedinophyceae sp. YPF-701]